jgi:penicillin-binding protein 2
MVQAAGRLEHLRLGAGLACLLLIGRLIQLQVIQGPAFREQAERNRLRLVSEQAPRGRILDREGRVLAANELVFRVVVVPQEVKDLAALLAFVSRMTRQPVAKLQRTYEHERSRPYLPATLLATVPKALAMELEEQSWRYPGLMVKAEATRSYPQGGVAAHVLGYLGQPSAEDYPLLKVYGVRPQELVGHMGLERQLDHALRGRPGGLMVEVNHRARQMRTIGHRAPEPGADIVLTLDSPLQSLLEQALGDTRAAGVILDPQTGAVLALASTPGFLPAAFVQGEQEAVSDWLGDDWGTPLRNRAVWGAYPPGSTAKLVVAAAGLARRVITPSTTVTCQGGLQIGDRMIHCWNRDGHGTLSLREALMQSCNVYFMTVGRRLGLPALREGFQQVGFGRATGWLLGERAGHVPDRRLTEGEVAMLAIGQSELTTTPLQIARMASVFANGGLLVQPWMIQSVGGQPFERPHPPVAVGWSRETLLAVRTGMIAVVADPNGTGHRAASPVVRIAGKTGTAQTGIEGVDHAWFAGFCPLEEPEAAIAILVENGGSGGHLPADVVRTVCEYLAVRKSTTEAVVAAPDE